MLVIGTSIVGLVKGEVSQKGHLGNDSSGPLTIPAVPFSRVLF